MTDNIQTKITNVQEEQKIALAEHCAISCVSFTKEGELAQVKYADIAAEKSTTVLGIRGESCVVLAVENVIADSLYEDRPLPRIFNVDKHIGMAIAGLLPDGRALVEFAVNAARSYRELKGRKIPLRELVEYLSDYMHAYTNNDMVRPFGAEITLASWDRVSGPELYKIEPSGVSYGYFASSSGTKSAAINNDLGKLDFNTMTTGDIVNAAAQLVYTFSNEGKQDQFFFEMSLVGVETNGEHRIEPRTWYEMAVKAGQECLQQRPRTKRES